MSQTSAQILSQLQRSPTVMAFRVISTPAPLAGMELPPVDFDGAPWKAAGFRWVLCLCSARPLYDPKPLKFLAKCELDDLCDGGEPVDPEFEEESIHLLAAKIRQKLALGEGVIVHCAGGLGRTGTLLGVVLVQLGYPAKTVIAELNRFHKSRGRPGWPESNWQARVVRKAAKNAATS